MKQKKQAASQNEVLKANWKKRILLETNYTEQCAQWMAGRLEALIDYMHYGHVAIAYMKQDGTFCLVRGTLINYEKDFHKQHNPADIKSVVVYWNVDEQRWTSFLVENFMEWKIIV